MVNLLLNSGASLLNGKPITYLTQWKIVGNSEVHTLPYPDGVVLPTGYKRCEYLIFDGNSYLNTGVKTANDLTINTAWLTNTSSRLLIGGRKSVKSNQLTFGFFIDGGDLVYNYGTTYNQTTIGVDLADMVKHTAIFGRQGMTIDSVFYEQSSKELTEFFDIYLGSWNTNNSSQSNENRKFIGNIYDTIISNTQGELWHGIPCLDDNDVPCFYDLVSQTAFYNQGSGSFTYKLYPQPTEIWSCGEYNATDGKYHILVQPQGGSIADITLTEPLRKVNDVADSIEFANGVATLTRKLRRNKETLTAKSMDGQTRVAYCKLLSDAYNPGPRASEVIQNLLADKIPLALSVEGARIYNGIAIVLYSSIIYVRNSNIEQTVAAYNNFLTALGDVEYIYELATPTTELVDAPQIAEAESYSMVISQGGKAVSWSEFLYTLNYLLTDSENNLLVDSENYKLTVQK